MTSFSKRRRSFSSPMWRRAHARTMLAPKMLALRALALVAAMLTAWPAAAFGRYELTCRMMGRVAKTCCCADSHAKREARSSVAEVRTRGCCELSQRDDHGVAHALRGAEPRLDVAGLATIAPLVLDVPERTSRTLAQSPSTARAPPPATAPLFLKNCVLLS